MEHDGRVRSTRDVTIMDGDAIDMRLRPKSGSTFIQL